MPLIPTHVTSFVRYLLCLLLLLLLSACVWGDFSPEPPDDATPLSDGQQAELRILTAFEVRSEQERWLGQVVTVQGVVTSAGVEWATLQSGAGGLLVAQPDDHDDNHHINEALRIAQGVVVSGRVSHVEGNLALLELEEWIIEEEQVPLPAPAWLRLAPEQESVYVQSGAGVVEGGKWLNLSDGRRIMLQAIHSDIENLLGQTKQVDTMRGVLRQTATGWVLLPTHVRDLAAAPPFVPVCEIQGAARSSAYKGEWVETAGIVVARLQEDENTGLFLQASECDHDPLTSDGVFVRVGDEADGEQAVAVGDQVRVRGKVEEFYGRTQLDVPSGSLIIEAKEQPLPLAVSLAPPANPNQAATYNETLEGMLVRVNQALVVGPTNRFGESAIVPRHMPTSNGHLLRNKSARGAITLLAAGGSFGSYDLAVGDEIHNIIGSLDYTFGNYKIQLIAEPTVMAQSRPSTFDQPLLAGGEWSLATFNAENLFDSQHDAGKNDKDSTLSAQALAIKLDKIAGTIAAPLGLPTVVALQEVENLPLLQQLAAHPLLEGRYDAYLLEGNDGRGIDQGLLIERKRVELLDLAVAATCSPVSVPGGSKEGGCPQGERLLFARPPLVAHLRLDGTREFYLINNHFKSKSGGEQETEPRRIAQAHFLASFITQLQRTQPEIEILVVGDLNDYEDSRTLKTLLGGTSLSNLWHVLPEEERYAYIFVGVSQVLDHILLTQRLRDTLVSFQPIHINADYPYALHEDGTTILRTSDHDPLLAIFR